MQGCVRSNVIAPEAARASSAWSVLKVMYLGTPCFLKNALKPTKSFW
jgi:hypothetical protein